MNRPIVLISLLLTSIEAGCGSDPAAPTPGFQIFRLPCTSTDVIAEATLSASFQIRQ
jgi:hypothetical protein